MNDTRDFSQIVAIFTDLIKTALPVIAGLALLVFIWGLVKFLFRIGSDEKAVGDGKNLMKWGLVALFVLVSFMAILSFLYRDIGFSGQFGLPLLPPYR